MEKKYILAAINIHTYIILSILLLIGITNIKLLNTKTSIILIIFLTLLFIVFISAYFTKNKLFYNTGTFITFLLNTILLFCIYNLNNEYSFIENIFDYKYQYNTYNIYVKKTTTAYNTIQKLDGKKIGLLNNNLQNISNHLDKQISITYKQYNTFEEIILALENGEIQCFIIKGTIDEYEFLNPNYKNKVRRIYTNKIKDHRLYQYLKKDTI